MPANDQNSAEEIGVLFGPEGHRYIMILGSSMILSFSLNVGGLLYEYQRHGLFRGAVQGVMKGFRRVKFQAKFAFCRAKSGAKSAVNFWQSFHRVLMLSLVFLGHLHKKVGSKTPFLAYTQGLD